MELQIISSEGLANKPSSNLLVKSSKLFWKCQPKKHAGHQSCVLLTSKLCFHSLCRSLGRTGSWRQMLPRCERWSTPYALLLSSACGRCGRCRYGRQDKAAPQTTWTASPTWGLANTGPWQAAVQAVDLSSRFRWKDNFMYCVIPGTLARTDLKGRVPPAEPPTRALSSCSSGQCWTQSEANWLPQIWARTQIYKITLESS